MIIGKENVILRGRLYTHVMQQSQYLRPVIRAVVDHLQEHLSGNQVFILPLQRFFHQVLVSQARQVSAHVLLNFIPMPANAIPVREILRVQRFWDNPALQTSEPRIIHTHQMNKVVPDGTVRVHRLQTKLLIG